MVEPILYASFGALLATLLGLLFLPFFWGRAVRLTTRRLLHRLPYPPTRSSPRRTACAQNLR
ncbi:hypothetical protein [Chenggangzhangella methanolivorans]|uniref:Uncharacterized protein n=1 Tax=Chenggangzhangella methanolivorans TaxID=1437009 RepID=A0A9E6R8H3_9HYPH|nr:hypothetical protein [Chenggangzhangella methanolivorans]QZN99249.1 hypothetical protein K6K41_20975 [Chenggangzhangella methanolivorans]